MLIPDLQNNYRQIFKITGDRRLTPTVFTREHYFEQTRSYLMHPVKSRLRPELVISDECIAEFSKDWDLACSGWSEEVRKGNIEPVSKLAFAIMLRKENGILQTALPFFWLSPVTLRRLANVCMEKAPTLQYFSYHLETVISPVLSGRFEPTPDFVADALYRVRDLYSSREKERAKNLLRILIKLGTPVLCSR